MTEFVGQVILGIIIIVMGIFNIKGNLSTLHRYHYHRVTEENRFVFGKLVGAGTVIIGVSVVILGILSFVSDRLRVPLISTIGSVIMIIGLIIGLIISFYAMLKYNRGIF